MTEIETSEPVVRRGQRVPYVVFERKAMTSVDKAPAKEVTDNWVLDLTGHAHPDRIQYYVRKGMKIISYWLPDMDTRSNDPTWAFFDVYQMIKFSSGANPRVKQLEDERTALEQRIKDYERKEQAKKDK